MQLEQTRWRALSIACAVTVIAGLVIEIAIMIPLILIPGGIVIFALYTAIWLLAMKCLSHYHSKLTLKYIDQEQCPRYPAAHEAKLNEFGQLHCAGCGCLYLRNGRTRRAINAHAHPTKE